MDVSLAPRPVRAVLAASLAVAVLAACGGGDPAASGGGASTAPAAASPASTTATDQPGDRSDRAAEEEDLAVVTALFADGAAPGLERGHQAVVARTAADGDLVAVHWQDTATPDDPWSGTARIDLFRVEDGRVAQRWSLAQPVPASGTSGHTMFDDAGPAAAPVPADEAAEEQQRQFVTTAYDGLFRDSDVTVLDRDFDPGYLQHNPVAGDGTAALAAFFRSGAPFPAQESAVSLSDGDLVWTFSRPVGAAPDAPFLAADVFRVQDGKIAEHWDVVPPAV